MKKLYFMLPLIGITYVFLNPIKPGLATVMTQKITKNAPKNTIYLIDGSGFLYRAYYGLRPLHTPDGIPVQAVYSFCRMMKKLAQQFKPEHMALIWDAKGKTERHDIYPDYKATRQEAPSDLFEQKKYITHFADLIGLPQLEQTGAEADDLLFSLAKDLSQAGNQVVIITSDKDMAQTVTDSITIYDPFKDETITRESFAEKMGFSVEKLPFYFALLGDASDNIPGVRGIGKKGATDLVQQFDSLEDLYNNLDAVTKERTRTALTANRDNAFLSEQLFLLKYYPLKKSKNELAFTLANWHKALPLFQELNFKSLVKEIEKDRAIPAARKEKLSELKGYNFSAITTSHDLHHLINEIKEKKIFALDTELDGLKPLQSNLIGLCIATHKGAGYYVPFGHQEPAQQLTIGQTPQQSIQLSRAEVLDAFKPLLEDPNIKKIMHHAKFDQLALAHYGIIVQGLIFDTLIAAYLVTKDWQRIGLKALSEFYLNEPMYSFAEVVKEQGYKHFGEVPIEHATEYAAADAHQTLQLYPLLQQELEKLGMSKLYYEIELPLVNVLFDMEREGITLDVSQLHQLDQHVSHDLYELKQQISSLVGDDYKNINLNSPKQLEKLLFEHLQLPPQKKSAKRTGYSTDIEVLQELAKFHPVPALIAKYRELYKLKSTYIDALPTYINPETHKIHTNFSQTHVATGRLSSSDPNMQNIPTSSTYDIHIRSAFKPEPGYEFLSADYSQIELRVLAELSRDQALVNAFNNDRDIHRETAAKLFETSFDNVTNEQRQIGKRINFSILYGLTPFGLSKDLGIPFGQAKTYIDKYFAQYPEVSSWMKEVIAQTEKFGYVTTYWNRRRYVPGIYEKNKVLHDLAQRIAINTKGQGTAAELMKKGMVQLDSALQEKKLGAKLVLQIHDELLLSVPIEHKEETENLVRTVLESVVDWHVPLKVTTRFGKDWQEVTK